MIGKRFCSSALIAFALVGALVGAASRSCSKTIQVRCQVPGHSIERALDDASAGDVISVQGICTEQVTITKDHITLDGEGSAVIRGSGMAMQLFNPLVGIYGAQGVVIRGMRVENGPAEAIAAQYGSAVSLTNVTMRGSTIGLMVAANSTAELKDCVMEANFVGLDMFTGSSMVLKGRVAANNNIRNGFDSTGSSTIEIRGAQVEANNNGGAGITMTDSQMLLLGFPPAQGSSITANGNSVGIIVAAHASISMFGDPGANSITTMNNSGSGILVTGGRILTRGGVRLVIEGNPTGIRLDSDGSAAIQGGLSIRNNGTGVLADGAGVVTVESTPVPSAITDNTNLDFDARFGSRIRLVGVSVGPKVACEPTVLRQGLACP